MKSPLLQRPYTVRFVAEADRACLPGDVFKRDGHWWIFCPSCGRTSLLDHHVNVKGDPARVSVTGLIICPQRGCAVRYHIVENNVRWNLKDGD